MKIFLAFLMLAASALAADVGRYQLVSGTVLYATANGTQVPSVMRIDTITGQVWLLVVVRTNATQWLDITPPK